AMPPVARDRGELIAAARLLEERDLHAIRGLEALVEVTPGSLHQLMDRHRAMDLQGGGAGCNILYLEGEAHGTRNAPPRLDGVGIRGVGRIQQLDGASAGGEHDAASLGRVPLLHRLQAEAVAVDRHGAAEVLHREGHTQLAHLTPDGPRHLGWRCAELARLVAVARVLAGEQGAWAR